MTDYIEEMMQTAGVEPYPQEILFPNEYEYPMFTPEKQLEIIKLIVNISTEHTYPLIIDKDDWDKDCYNFRSEYINDEDEEAVKDVVNPDFTQALAQLTTKLMNAGELDKKKVKEILEK